MKYQVEYFNEHNLNLFKQALMGYGAYPHDKEYVRAVLPDS